MVVAWVEGLEEMEVGESGSGDFGSSQSTGGGEVGRSGSLRISSSSDGLAFSRGLCKPNIRFSVIYVQSYVQVAQVRSRGLTGAWSWSFPPMPSNPLTRSSERLAPGID
jgi:hypothetical protein